MEQGILRNGRGQACGKYMTDWMMVRSEEERITVLPAVGRLAGQYPSDYKGDGEE